MNTLNDFESNLFISDDIFGRDDSAIYNLISPYITIKSIDTQIVDSSNIVATSNSQTITDKLSVNKTWNEFSKGESVFKQLTINKDYSELGRETGYYTEWNKGEKIYDFVKRNKDITNYLNARFIYKMEVGVSKTLIPNDDNNIQYDISAFAGTYYFASLCNS